METKKKLSNKSSLLATICILLFFGVSQNAWAVTFFQVEQENTYNLYRGKVMDSDTKKPLVFANISIENTNISTISNTEGDFSLKVPKDLLEGKVIVSYLGYGTTEIPLAQMNGKINEIALQISVIELPEISLAVPKDAEALIRETFKRKGDNYFNDPTLMTAFYRETIKKRRRNVSLSEAVVNIYKSPYDSEKRDAVTLYKARKSTDYSRLDTLILKLQGGPFNTLFVDLIKYPEYIFTEDTFADYIFSFENSTQVNNQLIYVINF